MLRGLHFQFNHPQAKLIRCVRGNIFDVAVDIRENSPTYGLWISQELSDSNNYQLFIPEGFAHGYYVLSDYAYVYYKCSEIYNHNDERGLIWNDSDVK